MSTSIPSNEIVMAPEGDSDIKEQCIQVRIAVFHVEQGYPLETEIDEFDPHAAHFLLRLTPSNTPVGTIRGVRMPSGYYKLGRLAVHKDYRTHKFGRDLVLRLHEWVKEDAIKRGEKSALMKAGSQLYARGFYAKYGYKPHGEHYDDEGEPHQMMVLDPLFSSVSDNTEA